MWSARYHHRRGRGRDDGRRRRHWLCGSCRHGSFMAEAMERAWQRAPIGKRWDRRHANALKASAKDPIGYFCQLMSCLPSN